MKVVVGSFVDIVTETTSVPFLLFYGTNTIENQKQFAFNKNL